MSPAGLGTKLRQLLALLDGDVQAIYESRGTVFRPKYFPVIAVLLREDGREVLSLAAAAGVSQPAMTQTLQALEQAGLVDLVQARDRRRKLVFLTAGGRSLAADLEPVWRAIETAVSGLDAELSASLSRVADEALSALQHRSFRARIEEALK